MKIVIIGAGSVGTEICSSLEGEGHDITLIDDKRTALEEAEAKYDVATVVGNGAEIATLRRAERRMQTCL